MPDGWTWPPSAEMKAEGKACLAHLDELGVEWKKSPPVSKIATPILLPTMEVSGIKLTSIWQSGPFPMDCFLAERIAESAAPFLHAAGVSELRFAEIHEYRDVGGKPGVLSRHALGLAIDVFEIVTDDGVKHVVKTDYKQADALLLTVEEWVNRSGGFRLLLTPGNDPEHHYDHFHFEARTPGEKVITPRVVAEK